MRNNKGQYIYFGGKKSELRDKPCPDCGSFIMRKSKHCRHCAQILERGPRWINNPTYSALHYRIRRILGTPSECKFCGRKDSGMYHWANISGEYLYNKDDWVRLCVSCHRRFDKSKGGGVHEFRV